MSTIEQIEHAEETRKLIEEGQFESKELPQEAVEVIGAEPVTKGVHAPPPVKHVNDGPAVGTFSRTYNISATAEGTSAPADTSAQSTDAPSDPAAEPVPHAAADEAPEGDLPALETLTVDDTVASDVGVAPAVENRDADVGLTTEGPAAVVEVVDSAVTHPSEEQGQ